jgi:hypothetical protein
MQHWHKSPTFSVLQYKIVTLYVQWEGCKLQKMVTPTTHFYKDDHHHHHHSYYCYYWRRDNVVRIVTRLWALRFGVWVPEMPQKPKNSRQHYAHVSPNCTQIVQKMWEVWREIWNVQVIHLRQRCPTADPPGCVMGPASTCVIFTYTHARTHARTQTYRVYFVKRGQPTKHQFYRRSKKKRH